MNLPIRRRTRVATIIDKSGSMRSHARAVTYGYADFVRMLREQPAELRASCVLFSDEIESVYSNLPVLAVPDLVYEPGGGTHLYDAIGVTVRQLERERTGTDRVLVVIMTDGIDAGSTEWTIDRVRALIERLEATGDWTFLFFGDNLGIAQKLGVQPGNIERFLSGGGVRAAFERLLARVQPLLLTEGASRTFTG